jgi:amidase
LPVPVDRSPPSLPAGDLCDRPAREIAALLQTRAVGAVEVLDAFLARIDAVNPALNALLTLDPERARAEAAAIDAARGRATAPGPWAGLPIAIKDMEATRGMRTTLGSPIFRDSVPDHDALFVERLRGHGLVILGKTNTPEFAMGSQTFNPVFGATRNPWDPGKTCGGSSGGAAVGVATGMLPFADGSDIGGSLRNPGNFNHVLGLRPCPGRVPDAPSVEGWHGLSVLGPIARTASDAAFLLAAMAGPDARDPLSIAEDPAAFLRPLDRDFRGVRVALSRTLGGLPVDPEVARVLEEGAALLRQQGCIVEDAEPDLTGADLAFDTQRALFFAARYAPLLTAHRHEMKDTAVWNIEQAWALTPQRIIDANLARTRVFHAMRTFLERYEFLLAPVNQVPPFPVDQPYVTAINGVPMGSYIEWMRSCTRISITSHPAASVPCGFTSGGLPVGVQVVGRYRDEFGVLQMAHAIERVNPNAGRRPGTAGGHA